jgi:hypothetical protein
MEHHTLQRVPIVQTENVIVLSKKKYNIGRLNKDKKLNILLFGPNVSRKHLKMLKTVDSNQENKWHIIDQNSSVGTFLNGHKIQPNIVYTLQHKDKIGIGCPKDYSRRESGDHTYVFQLNAPMDKEDFLHDLSLQRNPRGLPDIIEENLMCCDYKNVIDNFV